MLGVQGGLQGLKVKHEGAHENLKSLLEGLSNERLYCSGVCIADG